jgi:hypothetical protein
MKADSLRGEGASNADNAESANLNFQAYQRMRRLINPFPEQFHLNAAEQAGHLRIANADPLNVGRNIQRLVVMAEQIAQELRISGIRVPSPSTQWR